MQHGDPDYRFKIVVIGSAGSGKTAMVDQLLDGKFSDQPKTTVGVDFRPTRIAVSQHVCELELWDTAGQETYRSIAKTYFRNSVGCVLVFDLTSQASFDELQMWLSQFRLVGDPNAVIILVGNKADLTEQREVQADVAEKFASDHLLEYIETSALTAQNVKETFEKMTRQLFESVQKGSLKVMKVGERKPDMEVHVRSSHGQKCC